MKDYDPVVYESSACSGEVTSTTAADILAAAGANNRWLVHDIMVTNSNTTTAALVTIQDEDNTKIWEGYAPAEGGWSKHFDPPLKCVTNKKVQVKLSASLGSDGAYACVAATKERVPS